MKRNRLYTILGLGCAVGYGWLFFAKWRLGSSSFHACFFKSVFGIPCPTCGATRSVLLLIDGNFRDAVSMNPIGIVIATIMIVLPLWLVYDLTAKKSTLFVAYKEMEQTVRIKWVAALLMILVAANWIWNFYKPL